jgi:hypothetical protein
MTQKSVNLKSLIPNSGGNLLSTCVEWILSTKSMIYLSIYLPIQQTPQNEDYYLGQQNIHVANPKKKLIIINYLKLR